MAQEGENIVLFPFMAQGHILPFLALGNRLNQKYNYSITVISTPLNKSKMKAFLPPNSPIEFLQIPFESSEHGLPPGTENTDSLSVPLIVKLIQASYSLQPTFEMLIRNHIIKSRKVPLCIIADMFFPWTADIAHELNIFHAIFNAGGGYGMACYHSLWLYFPMKKKGSRKLFPVPRFPPNVVMHAHQIPEHIRFAKKNDTFTDFHRRLFFDWDKTDAFLYNTVEEMDGVGLKYFRGEMKKPVWAIGPVHVSNQLGFRDERQPGMSWEVIKQWLDSRPEKSVLYISFGSQSRLSVQQTRELAEALGISGTAFIWVLRTPLEYEHDPEFNPVDCLPQGFKDWIAEESLGLLVPNWAPQLKILTHNSVSAFLSHCGWNSVLEALANGVPLLSWPMIAEQHFNAKMLEEELGVCVHFADGVDDEIDHRVMMEKLDMVLKSNSFALQLRINVQTMQSRILMANIDTEGFQGSSIRAMDEFLSAALLNRASRASPL